MRLRPRELSGAIPRRLRDFVLPVGDFREVWQAWQAFDAALTEWERANPDHADAAYALRSRVPIPDEPWDPSAI